MKKEILEKFKEEFENDFKLSSNRLGGDHLLSGFLLGLMSGNDAVKSGLGSFFAIKSSNLIAQKDYLNAALNIFYGYTLLKDKKMGKDFKNFQNNNGFYGNNSYNNNNDDYAFRYNQAMINASNAGAMGQFCPRFNSESDFVNYWCPRGQQFGGGVGYGYNNGYNNNAYNQFMQNNTLFQKINNSIDNLICQLPFVNIADRGTIRLIKGILIGAFIFYLLNNEKSQEFIFSNIIKGSSFLQGFVEEIKERFEDIKAEIEEEKEAENE